MKGLDLFSHFITFFLALRREDREVLTGLLRCPEESRETRRLLTPWMRW
jgi:hypothetical protein